MRASNRSIAGLIGLAALAALACGSGDLGIGNGGNRFVFDELAQELAEALATAKATPAVPDETLVEIYEAIVQRARTVDPQAALVVLLLAQAQRAPADAD